MFTLFLAPFFSKVDTFEGALHFFYDAVESFLLDYKVEPHGKVDFCVWFFLEENNGGRCGNKKGNRFVYPSDRASGLITALKMIPPKPRGFGDEYHDDLFMMASSCFHPSLLIFI